MKRLRICSIVLIIVLVMSCFTGCKKSSNNGGGLLSTNTDHFSPEEGKINIEVSLWRSGLGSDFLDALIEGFEKKYPDYNVYYSATSDQGAALAAYGVAEADTVDLYMVGSRLPDEYNLCLNDVLDTTVEGESKSIREKFLPSYLAQEIDANGDCYTLTYGGGVLGIVYNEEIFKQAGIEYAPRTTDELAVACSQIYDIGIAPLCHYIGATYWYAYDDVWFAQYNGTEAYNDFYTNPSKDKMLAKDGRYQTLKVFEKLSKSGYILSGSNAEQHTSMQTKFLAGRAAMMVTGSWLQYEMGTTEGMDNFKTMRTPVISAIKDRLTSVKSDRVLRELVTAIDNVDAGTESIEKYKDGDNYKVGDTSITAKDWEEVRIARNTVCSVYGDDICIIPKYSDSIEGAKKFLTYMYSDEGLTIYSDTLHMVLPVLLDKGEISTEGWTGFELSQKTMYEKSLFEIGVMFKQAHPLFIQGGASSYPFAYISQMTILSENDKINAEQAWDSTVKSIEGSYAGWEANIK